MATKSGRFDLDFWAVSKRSLYIIVVLLALGVVAGGVGVYIWTHGNPFKNTGASAPVPAGARFDSFDGDVRVVRAQTRETVPARSDTQLYPGDIVQTQADGRARISLIDGSTLIVRPNSVVTIRDNTSDPGGGRTNVRVAVARGQINVRTEQQAEGTSNIVETQLTENRLASQTGASFGVREDNSEDIRVASGSVDTNTRGGEKTTLRAGEFVAINQSGSVARRERLLDVPTPVAPRDLERIPSGGGVALRWQRPGTGAAAHYRVEVATSPFFVATGKVIERDQLDATEFNAGSLRPGNYFWRVRAMAASGQASEWSEPQKFIIAPTGSGERVTVSNLSFEYVAGSIYLVRGQAQAGTTIHIGGRETLAGGDGSFQLQINAPRGTREITVEAQDPQGNKNRYQFPFSPDAAQK